MKRRVCPACDELLPAVMVSCYACGATQPDEKRPPGATYWDALLAALRDFEIDGQELERLTSIRDDADLSLGQVKALHAGAASWYLSQYALDGEVDSNETTNLRFLWASLSALGWAPGE